MRRSRLASGSLLLLQLLLVLTLLTHCCAYLRHADSHQQLNNSVATADYKEARRFSWVINWMNERGPVGQVFANLVIALFVLPPLGPLVCSFLENCDSTRASARRLIQHLASDYSRGRSLSEGALAEDVSDMLRWLDEAYDEYS